ncbi:MAG TPA: hypothetical protein VFT59_00300 [Candidatus Saccharimonadales bacterium]|nr:hypothetical protein [Candidatus Saccharimonadales bacterium]
MGTSMEMELVHLVFLVTMLACAGFTKSNWWIIVAIVLAAMFNIGILCYFFIGRIMKEIVHYGLSDQA